MTLMNCSSALADSHNAHCGIGRCYWLSPFLWMGIGYYWSSPIDIYVASHAGDCKQITQTVWLTWLSDDSSLPRFSYFCSKPRVQLFRMGTSAFRCSCYISAGTNCAKSICRQQLISLLLLVWALGSFGSFGW